MGTCNPIPENCNKTLFYRLKDTTQGEDLKINFPIELGSVVAISKAATKGPNNVLGIGKKLNAVNMECRWHQSLMEPKTPISFVSLLRSISLIGSRS